MSLSLTREAISHQIDADLTTRNDNKGLIETAVNAKAEQATTYTKVETDNLLDEKETIANVDILKGTGWVNETVKGNADDIENNAVIANSLLQRQLQAQFDFPPLHPSRIPQLANLDASKVMYFRCSAGRFNFKWTNPSGRLWTFPEDTVLHSDGVTPIRTSTDQQPDVDVPAGVVTLHSDGWNGDYSLEDSYTDTRFVGNMADLPSLTYYIYLRDCSQFTGDLSDCPVLDYALNFGNCSLITGAYIQVSGNDIPTYTYLDNTNISPADMDATLIAYETCTKDNGTFHADGMGRTTASDTAVSNLTARGWTISGLTVV